MQLLEAIESISRQRSVETVELALLQTLGQNFNEVEEALRWSSTMAACGSSATGMPAVCAAANVWNC